MASSSGPTKDTSLTQTSDAPTTKEILIDQISESLGKQAVQTVQPIKVEVPTTSSPRLNTKPFCATQRPMPRNLRNGPASIMVGMKSECPRWIPGSVVKWAAWQNGFDTKEDADYAAKHLAMAAEKWNSFNIGVTFQWVADAKDATFVLCHGGDRDTTLAQSFFPNENDLSFFLVYTGAFKGAWKENMWKVFTHELGHIIGLRHEFAMFPDEQGGTMEAFAVQIGPQNPDSVMNYNFTPPEIQSSDVKSVTTFYAMKKGTDGKDLMVGMTVLRDYMPS